MNTRTQKPFPLFELTFIVALVLIGWVAFHIYEIGLEADESRKQLADLRTECFRISVSVQSSANDLNSAVTSFLRTKDAVEKARFEQKSQEFQQWLEKENRRWPQAPPPLTNPLPRTPAQLFSATNQLAQVPNELVGLLSVIGSAYTNYQRAARSAMANAGQP